MPRNVRVRYDYDSDDKCLKLVYVDPTDPWFTVGTYDGLEVTNKTGEQITIEMPPATALIFKSVTDALRQKIRDDDSKVIDFREDLTDSFEADQTPHKLCWDVTRKDGVKGCNTNYPLEIRAEP